MGLPIPEPVFVNVSRQKVPPTHRHRLSQETVRAFGSIAVDEALPVSRIAWQSGMLDSMVRKWAFLEPAAVFDCLIASDDRSEANILLAPDQSLWLIDHARSLGGGGDRLFSSEFFPSIQSFWTGVLNRLPLSERLQRTN